MENEPLEHANTPLPTAEEIARFTALGLEHDSLGRPLHPWAGVILEQDGAIPGKGAYWNWGPNYTADPIVITDEETPRVLLIQRSDTLEFALPGGFIDAQESAYEAAIRELQEETGLTGVYGGEPVYRGPVIDPRTTLHAWPETSAYLFSIEHAVPVQGADDALIAAWYPVNSLPKLFGSHALLIQEALLVRQKTALRRLLSLPETARSVTRLELGHMAYDHFITAHADAKAFVKQHNPSLFTDPHREAHSKAYLLKEHWCYEHLRAQDFPYIPDAVELIDDAVLAMTHLDPEDGWRWRAPRNNPDAYIVDILASFSHLQTLDYPDTASFHDAIHPTYATFWEEGWDTFNKTTTEVVKERLRQFAQNWEVDQQNSALDLLNSLEALSHQAQHQDRNPQLAFAHNDARQSNIAWHQTEGVRLVDWSWADKAPKNADATMFLIDMSKSGFSIDAYREHLNPDYIRTLIGFWLAHSIEPTRDGSTKVREHQAASACIAFGLLPR